MTTITLSNIKAVTSAVPCFGWSVRHRRGCKSVGRASGDRVVFHLIFSAFV